MAYNMTTWQKGDVIDSERLNKIEKGLTAAIAGLEAITGMKYDAQYFSDFQPNKLNVTGDSEIKGSLRLVQNTGTTPKTNPCIELDTYNGVPSGTARIWYAGANSQTDTYGTNTLIIGETKNVNLAAADITGVNLTATGGLTVSSTAALNGIATVGGTLGVTGKTTLSDELEVVKDTAIKGALTVGTGESNKKTTLNGNLETTGNADIKGDLTIGVINNDPEKTVAIYGKLNTTGKVSAALLDVTGTTTLNGALSAQGAAEFGAIDYTMIEQEDGTSYPSNINYTKKASLFHADVTMEHNLYVLNDSVFGTAAQQSGQTVYRNSATFNANAIINGNLIANGTLSVSDIEGSPVITGVATINGGITTNGTATLNSHVTIGEDLTIGNQDTTAQPYYTIADFNTDRIYLSKPVSFFNNSTRNEFIQATSRDITQNINGSNFSLINFRTTTTNNIASHSIYFGSSDTNTFIDGDTVTLVGNDLEFTVDREYTYRFIGDDFGFGLSSIYEGSTATNKPDHALFRYSNQETQQQDMMIIGGKYNSVETTDSSLVYTTYINAKANVVLQTQNSGSILMQNNTTVQHGNFTINEGEFIIGDTHLTEQELIALKARLNSNS